MSSLLEALIPEIRIYGCNQNQNGGRDELEHYIAAVVPRVGDHICIQYWTAEVYRVEWTIIDGRTYADVFCDTSEIDKKLSKQPCSG